MKDRFHRLMACAGLQEKEYQAILGSVRSKNRITLCKSSAIGAAILLALTLYTFLGGAVSHIRYVYALTALVFIGIYLLSTLWLPAHEKWTLALCYVFLGAAFDFAIVLGVRMQPDIPATTVCVLLAVLPLLLIDRPWRMSLLILLAAVAFALASATVKEARFASLDRVNAISFAALSIAVNFFMLQVKLNELLSRRHVEKERDTDDLTKLLTKTALSREITAYMEQGGGGGALLVIDVDNFKGINDTLGHAYGDAVLRIMGECIRKVFRSNDLLGRFGGDEFVLFLPSFTSREQITSRVDSLIHHIQNQTAGPDTQLKVTVSIGIAVYPEDAADYDTLFRFADEALYTAKGNGKNGYAFYLQSDRLNENL